VLVVLAFIHLHLVFPILLSIFIVLIIYVASLLANYFKTNKERKFIRTAFSRYMSPELVKELLKNPKNLQYGGVQRELTVLFSDVRSFTPYAESHSPHETVAVLQEYLTAMVDIIFANDGILDKFVGDEIMALYGTPLALQNHALAACKTALAMHDRLKELQAKWISEGKDPFDIGIGINTGTVIVGNLGSEQIFDYTAIGDAINLGARLEGVNKEYHTAKKIIISEFTYEKVKDLVKANYLDAVNVKGKEETVKIYELIDVLEGN
jgi:adenylate cyclase